MYHVLYCTTYRPSLPLLAQIESKDNGLTINRIHTCVIRTIPEKLEPTTYLNSQVLLKVGFDPEFVNSLTSSAVKEPAPSP
jgi:hypothetical protein